MVPARASLLRTSVRRVGVVALVAALLIVGTVTAVVAPAPGRAGADTALSGPGAPAQGVLFGAHTKTGSSEAAQQSGVEALEAKLGRKLAIDHYYRPWTTTFPTTREQWDFDNGRIPMISWAVFCLKKKKKKIKILKKQYKKQTIKQLIPNNSTIVVDTIRED